MPTYRVPLLWTMSGTVEVEAKNMEDAKTVALGPETSLPDLTRAEVVPGSWRIDSHLLIEKVGR